MALSRQNIEAAGFARKILWNKGLTDINGTGCGRNVEHVLRLTTTTSILAAGVGLRMGHGEVYLLSVERVREWGTFFLA